MVAVGSALICSYHHCATALCRVPTYRGASMHIPRACSSLPSHVTEPEAGYEADEGLPACCSAELELEGGNAGRFQT